MRIAGAALLAGAIFLGALGGGIVGAAKSPAKGGSLNGGKTTYFKITGKFKGTLTLSDPKRNCTLTNGAHQPGGGGASVVLNLTGKIPGLSYKTWTFNASVPKGGTNLVEKGWFQGSAYDASLRPIIVGGSPNIGFFAFSGTITIGAQDGSATFKMGWDSGGGKANDGNVTISGSWDCPVTIQS
jgi:hypothetical protein